MVFTPALQLEEGEEDVIDRRAVKVNIIGTLHQLLQYLAVVKSGSCCAYIGGLGCEGDGAFCCIDYTVRRGRVPSQS